MRYSWVEPDASDWAPEAGGEALLRMLLARRGLTAPEAIDAFLRPHPSALADPFRMADMGRAVDRLAAAHRRREPVAIHRYRDIDGLTSTAILARAERHGLRRAALRVAPLGRRLRAARRDDRPPIARSLP